MFIFFPLRNGFFKQNIVQKTFSHSVSWHVSSVLDFWIYFKIDFCRLHRQWKSSLLNLIFPKFKNQVQMDTYIYPAGGRRFSIKLNCLKWGFVITIIAYIYSQKCNENANEKRLIYFELWFYFAFKSKQKWNQQIINKKKF